MRAASLPYASDPPLTPLSPAAPSVSDILSPNRPLSTALSVTVSGLNFDYIDTNPVDTTPTTQVALGACQTSSWLSGTSLVCFQAKHGTPADQTVVVTVAGFTSTNIGGFSFDAPSVSARGVALNIAGSVTISTLSVIGLNFAYANTTPSGRLGTNECNTMAWSSATSSLCIGTLVDPMAVTVGLVVGTMTLSFTYDAPVVSFTWAQNIVVTDGGIVTMTGLNFRTKDYTPTINFDSNTCSTTAWTSKTSAVCNVIVYQQTGAAKYVGMTVTGYVGTSTNLFSFDGTTHRRRFFPAPTPG